MRQLPAYQCHKKVWALKIAAIELANPEPCQYVYSGGAQCGYGPDQPMHIGSSSSKFPVAGRHEYKPTSPSKKGEEFVGAIITPEENGYTAFPVSTEYVRKHKPVVGGYWVQYADGYQSFSPANAFEEGYTLIR
jgi:hypothetical protein